MKYPKVIDVFKKKRMCQEENTMLKEYSQT